MDNQEVKEAAEALGWSVALVVIVFGTLAVIGFWAWKMCII